MTNSRQEEIRVYALEHRITHDDHLRDDGVGTSKQLPAPVTKRIYTYEENYREPGSDILGTSGFLRQEIREVAADVSHTYRERLMRILQTRGKNVRISFEAPTKGFPYEGGYARPQPLTETEQEQFFRAFQEANRNAKK